MIGHTNKQTEITTVYKQVMMIVFQESAVIQEDLDRVAHLLRELESSATTGGVLHDPEGRDRQDRTELSSIRQYMTGQRVDKTGQDRTRQDRI